MCLVINNKDLKNILHDIMDWRLVNSLIKKAISKIHTINFLDKFAELFPDEEGVIFWNITNAGFFEIEPIFIDKNDFFHFFEFELILIGSAEVSFTGSSGKIYMTDLEITSHYSIRVKNRNFVYYQAQFYEEEIGFIIDYSKVKRVLF